MGSMQAQGEVAAGWEPVRDAFVRNFVEHGDVGAAVSVYAAGEKVVDLWGGTADLATGAPWEEETTALAFSTTKGVAAIVAHLLAQRGELDLDAPVASYWPEFGVHGKDRVTVRQALGHQAGVPAFETHLTKDEALDWDVAAARLAAEAPAWEPGTAHGYHAMTYGWIVGEVVRRITGRSLGAVLADEVSGPRGLDVWIGLPESEEANVSKLNSAPPPQAAAIDAAEAGGTDPLAIEMARAMLDPASLLNRALNVTSPPLGFNSRKVHAAELPAANAVATARGLAKLYALTVGDAEGKRLLDDATVDAATEEVSNGPDKILLVGTRFGAGFFLPSAFSPLMGPRSFGHAGAGGSLAFADRDADIGFAYVMNQMRANVSNDLRTSTLIDAVRTCAR